MTNAEIVARLEKAGMTIMAAGRYSPEEEYVIDAEGTIDQWRSLLSHDGVVMVPVEVAKRLLHYAEYAYGAWDADGDGSLMDRDIDALATALAEKEA
jgi:hypothetical protein